MIDLLLYKEALSACGWSTIKTEELEKLRADLEEAIAFHEGDTSPHAQLEQRVAQLEEELKEARKILAPVAAIYEQVVRGTPGKDLVQVWVSYKDVITASHNYLTSHPQEIPPVVRKEN